MKADLIARIAYEPETFEAFYREYLPVVQRFVARRVNDPPLAADLTADVFLAVIDASPRFDPRRGEVAGWLHGVARNVVAAEFRRQSRAERLHSRIQGRRLLDEDDVDALVERIDAERAGRDLFAAMATLPDGERAVLELVAIDGLSVTEAAAALNIRSVTARVRLHRARATMRDRTTALPSPVPAPAPANLEAS